MKKDKKKLKNPEVELEEERDKECPTPVKKFSCAKCGNITTTIEPICPVCGNRFVDH